MTRLIDSDDKNRDLTYDEAYRWYLVTRSDPPIDYRFGRLHGKRFRVHARTALRRANGYLKNMIEAIANAKLRRMERDLELRGIRYERASDSRQTLTSQSADHSR
jgi:hypothetical protein